MRVGESRDKEREWERVEMKRYSRNKKREWERVEIKRDSVGEIKDKESFCLFVWFSFLTSSSTTRLYRGRAPRQSV